MRARWAAIGSLVAAACGGSLPETRYYQLASPGRADLSGEATVVLEPLAADGAFDDERIVYRTSPYALGYYQYRRWIAAPSVMVGDYLASALARTGRFRALPRELTDDAHVVLGGRVVALEEVDEGPARWTGHVAIDLTLTDAHTGATLWSHAYDEREPLAASTPEALAAALSTATARIAADAAPAIATHAAQARTAE